VFKPSIGKFKDPIIEKKLGSKHIKLVYASKGPGMEDVEVPERDKKRFVLEDDEIAYVPTREAFTAKDKDNPTGGYEVQIAIPNPNAGYLIVNAAISLVNSLIEE
jgi:hypothetical protein